MKQEEGYIKFNPKWEKMPISIEEELLFEINSIRNHLMDKNWLGALTNGIGFGNISLKHGNNNQFFITGSATGKISKLQPQHIALVEEVNIDQNSLRCKGESIASSESMSHAVFYTQLPDVKSVIHIHSSKLWNKYKNVLPTSNVDAKYGTPEMAKSLLKLLNKTSNGIIIMGGHEDGIIAYADQLSKAFNLLIELES